MEFSTKLIEKTYGEVFDETVEKYPDNEAVVYPFRNLRLTWKELQKICNQLAKGIIALGIKKDDKIAVWAYNVPEWIYLMIACSKIGAILTTVNIYYKHYELEYILNQSDSVALFMVEGFKDVNYVQTIYKIVPELETSELKNLKSQKLHFLKSVIFIGDNDKTPRGMYNFQDILDLGNTISDEELADRQKALNAHEVINMQYTSGTTGFPKGAMLTHHNIINNAYLDGFFQKFTPKDRLCICVPFFHCFGCVIGITACIVHSVTMVPVEIFDAGKVLKTIEMEKCTVLHGVPTMFIAELNHPDFEKYNLSSLRTGVMAGAICPEEVMRNVMEKMHMKEITICYGLTEASPVVTQTLPTDPLEKRVTTVGKAHPNVEIKIMDKYGNELPVDTAGELCIKGYCVMKGYYKMPEKTQQTIRDGWLHSGDLAMKDKNGYFIILGRIDDMIIRGGENVYPKEIENYLYNHPKIKDVAVIGVPSKKYGEEIATYITLRENTTSTEEEIRNYCKNGLARYKVPKYIKFIEAFPTTASGKIQKFKLREMAKKDFLVE